MKKLLWFSVLVMGLGLWFSYSLIKMVAHEDLFDGFIVIIFALISAIVLFIAGYNGVIWFRQKKQLTGFIPLGIGVCLALALCLKLYTLGSRDRSPLVLSCVSTIVDFNGVTIDFRENNMYKLSSAAIGVAEKYWGTYSLKDSVITLDRVLTDGGMRSKRFLIRDKYIYQINDNGEIMRNETMFRVR